MAGIPGTSVISIERRPAFGLMAVSSALNALAWPMLAILGLFAFQTASQMSPLGRAAATPFVAWPLAMPLLVIASWTARSHGKPTLALRLMGAASAPQLLLCLLVFIAATSRSRSPDMPTALQVSGSGAVRELFSGDWDIVCYVAPYENAKEMSEGYFRKETGLLQLTHKSSVIGEHEFGFLLIDSRDQSALLDVRSAYKEETSTGFLIEGARCVSRGSGTFETAVSRSRLGQNSSVTTFRDALSR